MRTIARHSCLSFSVVCVRRVLKDPRSHNHIKKQSGKNRVKFLIAGRTLIVCALLISSSVAQSVKPAQSPAKFSNEWTLRGKLIANPHDRDAHEKLCMVLEQQAKYRKAVEERKAWLEDNPGDYFELITLITTANFILFDPEYALEAAEQFPASVNPGDNFYAWSNDQIGTLLTQMQRFAEAIPHLEAATKVAPNFSDYWLHLSSAYVGTKQFDKAISASTRAVDLDPASATAHVQLGEALGAKGDLTAQETEFKAACNIDKDDALLKTSRATRYVSLAKLQIVLKEYPDAEKSAATALRLNPNELYAYLVRARAMELDGHTSDAASERNRLEVVTRQLMEKEKKPSGMKVPLAIFALNDSPELVRLLEPAQQQLTSLERMLLAIAYFDLGRSVDGETQFRKALEDPVENTAQSHFTLAELFKKAEWTQKAVKEYGEAYEMDPENWTYRYKYESLRKQK
jgi:tetratricopeptide (TPR) repeat protein